MRRRKSAKCTIEFTMSRNGPSAVLYSVDGRSINTINYPRGTRLTTKKRAQARRILMAGCAELSKK